MLFQEAVLVRRFTLLIPVFLLVLAGCPTKLANLATDPEQNSTSATRVDAGPLRVLVWDDLELTEVMEREWQARSESQCDFTNGSSSDWLDVGDNRLDADVIVFPSRLLGELAERRLLRSLPTELLDAPGYEKLNIFDLVRRREMKWDAKSIAVPFGSPSLMLLTRTDLVPESATPTTWDELRSMVDRIAGNDDSVVPLLQPLADGWAARMLLARAAPYFYDRAGISTVFDFRTLEPRLASPPFIRALDQMMADQRGQISSFTPGEVLREFLAGKAAMAITWPSALVTSNTQDTVGTDFPMAIFALPGSNDRYDFGEEAWSPRDETVRVTLLGASGRLGAISRTGRNIELATRFLGWATGPEYSLMISSRSGHTAPFRDTHRIRPGDWVDARISQDAAAQYEVAVGQAMKRAEGVLAPRIPAQHQYMKVLDSAVLSVLKREVTSDVALTGAVNSWEAITEQIGRPAQLKAYYHSLGIGE